MSKLSEALKKKFHGDARAVLRALGLDENLLKDAREEIMKQLALDAKRGLARDDQDVVWSGNSPALHNPAVEEGERLAARAKDGGQMTGAEVEKILRLLREAGVDGRAIQRISYALSDGAADDLSESDREELRRTEKTAPTLDDIRSFMRSKGMGEDVIEEALDMLPKSAMHGGFGGRLAGDAALRRLDAKFPGIGRIAAANSNFGVHRHEIDRRSAPSRAQLERFYDRFPGARNITAG